MSDKQGKSKFGFSHALNGIGKIIRTEQNFRFHMIASLFVIVAGIILRLSAFKWIFIVLAIGLVLVAEILNTVIEKMVDYVKPDIHPRAKVIKDMAAGAVLIASIVSATVGLLIFIPELYRLFVGS
ncbi:diacylglycerol kinase family protein [Lentibacillus amyloliquefaciens]|uniref:Diacylglycerol kinase n=1 Tax=Lentibacillus amyloliquefaciens TaxID=1472767 RepID=A0A0U4F5N7_9BACI|nr:diacylglycerol kinase family protein [Lentibacillus amyloliquefaciens]ALX48115.1 diacylglycerol kinase [Lentibacillus amyloliquefaciens]